MTPAHRSVPASRPFAPRSTHVPADFFIPDHRSAPAHRIISALRSPLCSIKSSHNHAIVTLNCYNLYRCFFRISALRFQALLILLYNANAFSRCNVVINRDRKYSFITNVERSKAGVVI